MNWETEDKIYKYTNIFLISFVPITIILLIFIIYIVLNKANALPNNANLPFNRPSIECGDSRVVDEKGRQVRVCIDFNTNCQWHQNNKGDVIRGIDNSCKKHYALNQYK